MDDNMVSVSDDRGDIKVNTDCLEADGLVDQLMPISGNTEINPDICNEHILDALADTGTTASNLGMSEEQYGKLSATISLDVGNDDDSEMKLSKSVLPMGYIKDDCIPKNMQFDQHSAKTDEEVTCVTETPIDKPKMVKQKRVYLSDEKKRQICLYKLINPKSNCMTIAEHFNKLWSIPLGGGKVYQIIRSRDKWLSMSDDSTPDRISDQDACEEALYKWYTHSSRTLPNSDNLIMKKARELRTKLHVTDMAISKNWLRLFKDKYDIHVQKRKRGRKRKCDVFSNGHKCFDGDSKINVTDGPTGPKQLVTVEEARRGAMTVISYFNSNSTDAEQYIEIMWKIYNLLSLAGEGNADPVASNVSNMKEEPKAENICKVDTSQLSDNNPVDMVETNIPDNGSAYGESSAPLFDEISGPVDYPSCNSSNQRYTCDICDSSYASLLRLLDHMACHATTETEKIKPKQIRIKRNMKHKKKEEKITYTCSTCGKTFNKSTHLHRHEMSHTGERPFKCSLCGKGFCEYGNLRTHMRVHTGERPYLCTICGKRFAQTSVLQAHMTVHTGEKKFKCIQCDRCFSQHCNLQEHVIAMHTDARPFICSECGKGFIREKYLDLHMRSHTGEKPYQCDVCNKQFSQNSYLRRHMEVHIGEKSHQCSTCGQRFITNTVLKSHIRTHTGERPYACKICGKTFSQGGTLHNHYKMHNK